MDSLKPIIDGFGTPPNFTEKTFVNGPQTLKSAKVFSLESFPLYIMLLHNNGTHHTCIAMPPYTTMVCFKLNTSVPQ